MANTPTKRKHTLWLPGRSVMGFLPESLTAEGFTVETVDTPQTYREDILDTDDWWLYRAGVTCRLRTTSGETRISLVPRSAVGEANRVEETLEGPPPNFPGNVPGKCLGELLRVCMPDETIHQRAQLDVEEKRYRITGRAGASFVLTALAGTLRAGGPASDFTEVSVAMTMGKTKDFKQLISLLVGKLNMTLVTGEVLSHQLTSAGVSLPELVESDDLVMHADDRFVDAAYRVLRRHVNRMLWHEPGTRLGLDPEHLHDMRVATRRLRAALRVFGEALPSRRTRSLRRDLSWLGGALGAVRDLDVYAMQLVEEMPQVTKELQPSLAIYLDYLAHQRRKARRSLLRVLGTKRYAEFVARIRRFLDVGPPAHPQAPRAAEPVTSAARDIILKKLHKVLDDVRSLDPQSPDAHLHKLRIRCKRLRYACEFFVDLYGKEAARFVRRVVALQDVLGEHQDAVVSGTTLSRFSGAISAPARLRCALHMAMGHLMAQHAERACTARARFFKLRKDFDRKKVRKPFMARLRKLATGAKSGFGRNA